jgi:hypothetical protein
MSAIWLICLDWCRFTSMMTLENPLGANPAMRDRVRMISVVGPLSVEVNNDEGWIYNSKTSEFLANSDGAMSEGTDLLLDL